MGLSFKKFFLGLVALSFVATPAVSHAFSYPYVASSGSSLGQWTTDYNSAVENAKSSGKPIVFVSFHECDHGCGDPLTSLDQTVKSGSYLVCMNWDEGKTGYRSDGQDFFRRMGKSSNLGQCTILYGGRRAGEVAEKFGQTHTSPSSVMSALASRYSTVMDSGSRNTSFSSSDYANALNASSLAFTTSSGYPWQLSGESAEYSDYYSTGKSVRSGLIGDSCESWLETTVSGPSKVSFKWMVSSEQNYDNLSFLVDGNLVGEISGVHAFEESSWETVTYSIPSGSHTLRWRYSKDGSVGSGMDGGWIADLVVEENPYYEVSFVGICSLWIRQYMYGEVLGTLPDGNESGCGSTVFDGWYTAYEGGTKISSATKVTQDVSYYAHWRTVTAKPTIACESYYTITPGVSCSIPIKANSTIKATTVSVSGLPKGLSFKSGKIIGKATKPGTYKVVVTAKNSKGTVRKTVTLKASNPGFNVTVKARVNGASSSDAQELASGDTVQFYVGVQQTISIASSPKLSGVASSAASVSVSGLPTGLTYKSGKITGVVRTKGTKTATIKFKNKWGWSRSFKVVFKAVSLPAAVTGTFNGFVTGYYDWLDSHEYAGAEDCYDCSEDEDECEYGDCDYYSKVRYGGSVSYAAVSGARVSRFKMTASSSGKLTAKLGSVTFTASKWSNCREGSFEATLTYGTKKINVYVDPSAGWDSASLSAFYYASPDSASMCGGWTPGYAYRNPFGKNSSGAYLNSTAGHMVKLLAKLGTTRIATSKFGNWWELACEACVEAPRGYKFPLAVKVSTSGIATLTGKLGSKTISATAPVRILENGSALATFVTNGVAIDLEWFYEPATKEHWDDWAQRWEPAYPDCFYAPLGSALLLK